MARALLALDFWADATCIIQEGVADSKREFGVTNQIYSDGAFLSIYSPAPSSNSESLRQDTHQPVPKLPLSLKLPPTVRGSINLRFASTTVGVLSMPSECQVSRQPPQPAAAVCSFKEQLLSISFSYSPQEQFKQPNTSPRQEPAYLKYQNPYITSSRSPRWNTRSDLA
ncbi:hypothetical protein PG997_001524 [Apiospora hydei]|uniref:Heterokaryon incompatibility domain-containing protein n=1 Tax=Apiospora hydei TaxID=1337664 RepID=A0ABR1XDU7_9PEZI